MSDKCKDCEIRKATARAFDLHWLGKDDCPWNYGGTCEKDIEDMTEVNDEID